MRELYSLKIEHEKSKKRTPPERRTRYPFAYYRDGTECGSRSNPPHNHTHTHTTRSNAQEPHL